MNQNNTNNSKIARNTSYFTLALAAQKVLSFIYFIIIARFIGPEKIGVYVSALAYGTLFGILIDIGLSTGLIREIAKNKDRAQQYLRSILGIKLIMALVSYILVIISVKVLELFGFAPPDLSLMLWAGIIMILDSFTLTFYAVFRGLQNLLYESIGTIINKIIIFTLGLISIKIFGTVVALLWTILIGSCFNIIYTICLLKIKTKILPLPSWDKPTFNYLFKLSIPFFIAGIFVVIYGNIDQILLKILTADKYAGWYSVAYKLTFALQFIPLAFVGSIYPAYAEYFISAKERLKEVFEKAMKYLMILALPLSLGIFVLADKIVIGLYTKAFAASVLPLQILILSLFFVFLNFPIGYLLNACDKQTIQTINIGIAVAINVILNLILIPKYTFIGAAISSLCSSVILFVLGMFCAKKIIAYRLLDLTKNFIKIFIAAAIMAIVINFFKIPFKGLTNIKFGIIFYLGCLIIIGVLIYFTFLFLFRTIKKSDIQYLIQSVTKRLS